MRHDAARPKKLQVEDQESTAQEPMRGSQPSVRRNPSTDQLKKRRQMARAQKTALTVCAACGNPRCDADVWRQAAEVNGRLYSAAENQRDEAREQLRLLACASDGPCGACGCTLVTQATVLPTNAERLQSGHTIRLPSGQRVKVKGVRPHENSGGHLYLDTDIGTSVVDRKAQFHVMQGDAAERGAPFKQPANRETPGNFNTNLSESTEKAKAAPAAGKCPSCGKGPLVNHGGKMTCRNCGYATSGGDTDFGEPGYRRPTAYLHDGMTAVARRAQTLVERTEQ